MSDKQKVIDNLTTKCNVYKIERLELLKIISSLSAMLHKKFRTEDQAEEQNQLDEFGGTS